MTVVSEVSREDFLGDGITNEFTFTVQSQNVDWMYGAINGILAGGSAVLNADQEANPGGVYTFDVIPPLDIKVSVLRNVDLTQLVDYPVYGAFPARNTEDALDKLTMTMGQMFNRYEDVVIEGDIEFEGGASFPNNRAITFKNENDSADPAELGIYRIANVAGDVWIFQTSNGAGGWSTLMQFIGTDMLLPFNAKSGSAPVDPQDLTTKEWVEALADGISDALDLKVNKTGDTMTGPLIMESGITMAHGITLNFRSLAGDLLDGANRIFNDNSNSFLMQAYTGGAWLTSIVINSSGIATFGLAPKSNAVAVDTNDLTRKDYVDAADQDLQSQISGKADQTDLIALDGRVTTNEGNIEDLQIDVTALEAEKLAIAGGDMTGDLTLFQIIPPTGSSAATRQWVEDVLGAIIGGLEFLGAYDASGNVNPPDGDTTGQFYIISDAGTLIVSVGGAAPAPQAVSAGDRIIWNEDEQWWAYFQNYTGNALSVSFDPSGTNYTETNVQAALVEADDSMFVHAAGNINETITGAKRFDSTVGIENNVQSQWLGSGNATNAPYSFSIATQGNDSTLLRKRNAAGDGWLNTIMNINTSGSTTFSGSVIFANSITCNSNVNTGNTTGIRFQNNNGSNVLAGSARMVNDASNTLQIQKAVVDNAWASSIEIPADGSVNVLAPVSISGSVEITSGGTLTVPNGTAASPVIHCVNGPTNGFFFSGGTVVSVARGGVLAAQFDAAGTNLLDDVSVVTREKGDARYGQLTGGNLWAGGQILTNNDPSVWQGVAGNAGSLQISTTNTDTSRLLKRNQADNSNFEVLEVISTGEVTLGNTTAASAHSALGQWVFDSPTFAPTSAAAPTGASDLTRKDYVDAEVATATAVANTKAQVIHHPDEGTAIAASVGDTVNLHVWDI